MIIIKKPVITEKMTAISEKLNRFAFIVDKNANKYQIKDAIEKLYDVKVWKEEVTLHEVRRYQRPHCCFQESYRDVERR